MIIQLKSCTLWFRDTEIKGASKISYREAIDLILEDEGETAEALIERRENAIDIVFGTVKPRNTTAAFYQHCENYLKSFTEDDPDYVLKLGPMNQRTKTAYGYVCAMRFFR
jgi:hypothetical protein